MSDDQLRVGIVGAARIAIKNCRALSKTDKARVVAIGSRDQSKAEALVAQYKDFAGIGPSSDVVVKAYSSYDQVLQDPDVDAVYIPLPTMMHVEWVQKAVAAKKHILLEKPISVSPEDADTIVNACRSNQLQFMDGTMWMHNPRTKKMREIIDNGTLGSIRCVTASFTFHVPDGFRSNIRFQKDCDALGSLGDLGWYCIRSILWTYNFEMPLSVTASPGARYTEDGVPICMAATLLFSGDRRASFDAGFDRASVQKLEIGGTLGTISLNDFVIPRSEEQSEFLLTTDHVFGFVDTIDATKIEKVVVSNEGKPQETCMFEEFAKCIQDAKNGTRGLNEHWPNISVLTQKVVCAVLESAQNGFKTINF